MKKYIYILACAAALMTTACNSDDPMDSCSKHDYADGQSPYLRTNSDATVEVSLEFPKARIDEAQSISLKDYAGTFHRNLNMTVDEVLDGLSSGKIVCYTINPTRGIWNLDAPTVGEYGWYWNSSSALATADNAVASVELDKASKSLVVKMLNDPAVGTSLDANLGLAISNGHDLDNYVRFKVHPVVTDPSKVVTKVSLAKPADDYPTAELVFADFTESIESNLGVSMTEFLNMYSASSSGDDNSLELYLSNEAGQWYTVDADGNTGWMDPDLAVKRPSSTAGGLGYWLDSSLNVTTWASPGSGSDCTIFIESGDKSVVIGRYPDATTSGLVYQLRFVYTLTADHSRFIEFIVEVTFE